MGKKKIKYNQLSRGYITLMSVIIIGTVGMAIGVSLLLSTLGNSENSFVSQQSKQASALANACAEKGLEQIRQLLSYEGTDSLSYTEGYCEYNVVITGASERRIEAVGHVGDITKRVEVNLDQIDPSINVVDWLAVDSFVGDIVDEVPDDELLDDENGDITICHKPGTPAEQTMVISLSAWGGHQGHGDSLGACSEGIDDEIFDDELQDDEIIDDEFFDEEAESDEDEGDEDHGNEDESDEDYGDEDEGGWWWW